MKTLATFALVAAVGVSNAFVISGAGPYDSDGPIGSATNGHLLGSNSGGSTLVGSFTFAGDLTDGAVGSYLSEARWNMVNTTNGVALGIQPAAGGTWSGTQSISVTYGALLWVGAGDNYNMESYESYNDPGLDATWTNVSFTFNDLTGVLNYGSYAAGTSFLFDTYTSNFDTELALYTADGLLLGTNDDTGGLQSEINAGVLAQGSYYLVAGGYNSGFVNYAAGAGAAAGNLNVQVNGTNVFAGAHAARTFTVGRFEVVPEPASMLALGAGALALIRRRRK